MPHARIELAQGDITVLEVDAIVNAANESLRGGGGVDGAIHRAAGRELLDECRTLGTCPAGEARITGGYRLPAKYVIHTVGPIWNGGKQDEAGKLRSCYDSSLRLAADNAVKTIAFPCIATGVYRFPRDRACEIAVSSVVSWLDAHELPETVIFCCFEDEDHRLYERTLEAT